MDYFILRITYLFQKYYRYFFLLAFFLIMNHRPGIASQPSLTRITYLLSLEENDGRFFRISITLENNYQPQLIFAMPIYLPYLDERLTIYKQVSNFTARGENNKKLEVSRLAPNRWLVDARDQMAFRVTYDLKIDGSSELEEYFSSQGTVIEGGMVFMYVEEHEHLAITTRFIVPEGWKLITNLRPTPYLYEYVANNYEELVDSPIQIGQFDDLYFLLKGKTFNVTVPSLTHRFDIDQFMAMIRKIVKEHIRIFDEIPFDNYLFIFLISNKSCPDRMMNHRSASVIPLTLSQLSRDVTSAAPLIAHTFFHVWNGCRIRPTEFLSIHYETPLQSAVSWFIDGITSYYADLSLVRTGIWDEHKFFNKIGQHIIRLQQNKQRLETTLEQASLLSDASVRKDDESFYSTKAYLVSLLLDLKIRQITRSKKTLDDVMRFLNWYFAKGTEGYSTVDLRRVISALCQSDLKDFFYKYIHGTVELPLRELLAVVGYQPVMTTQWVIDWGPLPDLSRQNQVLMIQANSLLAQKGLQIGDEITEIDTMKITSPDLFFNALNNFPNGTDVTIKFNRNSKRHRITLTVIKKEQPVCLIEALPRLSELQIKTRREWLALPSDIKSANPN